MAPAFLAMVFMVLLGLFFQVPHNTSHEIFINWHPIIRRSTVKVVGSVDT
jgi:hypothetical protein